MSGDSFEVIVKRYDSKPAFDPSYQTLISQEEPSRPWWSKKAHYVVSRDRAGRATARGTIAVALEDHERAWSVTLDLDYKVTVAEDGLPATVAQRVVDGLARESNPRIVFESRVAELVLESVKGLGGLAAIIDTFQDVRTAITRRLRDRLMRDVGLDVELRVDVVSEPGFKRIHATRSEITTELSDYAGPLTAALSIELVATDSLRPHIYTSALGDLDNNLVAAIRDWFTTVSLHQLHFHFDESKSTIHDRVARLAADHGRTVRSLGIRCPSPVKEPLYRTQSVSPDALLFKRPVSYPDTVRVEIEVQANLVDLGRYFRHGMPGLETWVRERFSEVVSQYLLNVSYIDLFRHPAPPDQSGFGVFDRKVAETKEAMRRELDMIGYDAYAISLRTNLNFDELRREFRLFLENETYELRSADYAVSLDIEVKARIDKEEIIRALFAQSVDIKQVIRSAIYDQVRSTLKRKAPHEYFGFTESNAEAPSVADQLRDEVADLLREQYGAVVTLVTCVPRLTELEKLFASLRRENRTIDVSLERREVDFKSVWRVTGIAPPHFIEFQSRQPTIEQLDAMVRGCIAGFLNGYSREQLMAFPDDQVMAALNQQALMPLSTEFGLTVKVIEFARRIMPEETAIMHKTIEERVSRISNVDQHNKRKLESLLREHALLQKHIEELVSGNEWAERDAARQRLAVIDSDIEAVYNAMTFASTTGMMPDVAEQGSKALAASLTATRALPNSDALLARPKSSFALPAGTDEAATAEGAGTDV